MADYLSELNEKQKEAVLHEGKSLLILAGAGSGKTRVITSKIVYLADRQGVDPESILAVTFTNKAAAEMRERVDKALGYSSGVMVRTFHSFGSWMLRKYGHYIGLPRNFTIYDDSDSLSLLQSLFGDFTKKALFPYAGMISRAKDYGLGPNDNLSAYFYDGRLPEIYESYQKRLDKIGNADFGDLILKPLQILREIPDVKKQLQSRFRTILVDEYQDSNTAQDDFLSELAGPDTYVCVVGDDDQSIYRFRGADIDNFLTFPKRFSNTDIIRLERNYRSTQQILDLAGAIVDNNGGRMGKKLWTNRVDGQKPQFKRLLDQEAEAEYCADLLGDRDYAGTAILYRTNAQSMPFESVFLRRGVPYRIVGSLRFYEREEIKDVLAYLSFLSNRNDEIALKRIINKPARGVGPSTFNKLVSRAIGRGEDLVKAAMGLKNELKGKSSQGLESFVSIINEADSTLEDLDLSAFIARLADISGLKKYYKEADEDSLSAKSDNIGQLISGAVSYPRGMEGLVAYLENVNLDRSLMAQAQNVTNAVTLITMHNTKGLEFERVIIAGLDDGLFPNSKSFNDPGELEEERRIFYVAATRAKSRLYLLSARSRFMWGNRLYFERSRFIDEIPPELFDSDGLSSQTPDYVPGMYVYHDDYGPGQIIKTWNNGAEFLVMVSFESGKQGTFIPKYQPLEKISYGE